MKKAIVAGCLGVLLLSVCSKDGSDGDPVGPNAGQMVTIDEAFITVESIVVDSASVKARVVCHVLNLSASDTIHASYFVGVALGRVTASGFDTVFFREVRMSQALLPRARDSLRTEFTSSPQYNLYVNREELEVLPAAYYRK